MLFFIVGVWDEFWGFLVSGGVSISFFFRFFFREVVVFKDFLGGGFGLDDVLCENSVYRTNLRGVVVGRVGFSGL